MAARAKSVSIKDLSGVVNSAVSKLNLKPPPVEGPWFYINPGVLCGLIFVGPVVEAQNLAASIAKEMSPLVGATLAPVVQQAAPGAASADPTLIPPNHVICGFKHDVQIGR